MLKIILWKNLLCPINNVKNFRKLLFFGEFKGDEKLPKAKDEAFIIRRLKYRVGKENKEK